MIFFNIIILLIAFFFQSIFPAIYFLSFKIYPDFLLIILLYFSSNNSRFATILIGFCIGFIQDLIVSLTSDLEILNKEYSDMMSPKDKMILIVGEAIVKTLRNHSNKQVNLDSSTTRHVIASDILDEILRVENSDDLNKEKKIENLKKRYTLGKLKFDSVIIADFNESLKSVITSLLYTDVLPKEKYIITFNQWFDKSLLKEINTQPIYYPSINKDNYDDFISKFSKKFDFKPNHLSLLSYDLVGLIYYLSLTNNSQEISKSFKNKNTFKGKIGIFEIEDNTINHQLNFYQINDGKLKEIF